MTKIISRPAIVPPQRPLLSSLGTHHFGVSVPDPDVATHGNKHMCFEVPNIPRRRDSFARRGR
jgi:hypothetical protein